MFRCPKISQGACQTPLDILDQSMNVTCSPDNLKLLEAFQNTRFVFSNSSQDGLYWVSSEPQCSIGIPGLAYTSTIMENGGSHYLEQGEVHPGVEGVGLQLSAQVTSSFFILISIFFPSVTGECVCTCVCPVGLYLCMSCLSVHVCISCLSVHVCISCLSVRVYVLLSMSCLYVCMSCLSVCVYVLFVCTCVFFMCVYLHRNNGWLQQIR